MDDIDRVHVWHIDLDGPAPGPEADLGPAESARLAGYTHASARARHAVAHGVLRRLLGHALGLPPADIPIRRGPLGKPELACAGSSLSFSLAHAGRHALVALTTGRAVGVDLDHPRPGFPLDAFVRRYFPPAEREFLLTSPPAGRPLAFVQLWTRKEALVKAAGARMALGVGQEVGVPGTTSVVRSRRPPLRGTWTVRNVPPPSGGAAAVALAGGRPYRVVVHDWATEAP
ncbi:4'-phosphopantetheinyl transferase [Streptomyces hygroscopicus subsp. hygroscopicus]|uniref:4'-phosphopantetheinyl transferase family protein n=1 Tax=Streptomyces sp. KHY 26 TaxID=3097359 RepID=UPI0024A44720|nr:4'-phosphopantetheinyl transferase superfamily protein [Streptomyces hygroscopicus]GLX50947.1 4'-phosphopantetheinyl transferase [Streptomyces hygroscopicus subsp. hygroscopicus]